MFRARPTVNTAGTMLDGKFTEVNENSAETSVEVLAHGRDVLAACVSGIGVNKRFWEGGGRRRACQYLFLCNAARSLIRERLRETIKARGTHFGVLTLLKQLRCQVCRIKVGTS